MLRGFLSGIIWGVIVSVIIGGAVSLFAPLPGREALRGPLGAIDPADQSVAPRPGASTGTVTSGDMAPAAGADTTSAPLPQTGTVETDLQSPTADTDSGGVVVQVESPVQPQSDVAAPTAPSSDSEPSISNDPTQPALLGAQQGGPAFPADQDTSAEPSPIVSAPQGETDMTPSAETPEPKPDVSARGATLPSVGDPVEAPETSPAPAALPELKPQLGQLATRITDAPSEYETNRLPSVGQDVSASSGTALDGDDTVPVIRYAAPFANPDNKPLMAIVLIDEGGSGMDAGVLAGFPYPLSFAINTLDSDAKARMATYRDKGFEVLALVDLPKFANASDVEVAMPAHLKALPQAVAVIEGQGDGLQGSKEISDQVTSVLQASGHGLVLLSNGLNTAQKLAARDGVPSATVFRDFDAKGQNAAAIRRFLDQAAFKAVQEGGVIMLGRLRPETVSALLLWGLADRIGTVALAPVSALLSPAQ